MLEINDIRENKSTIKARLDKRCNDDYATLLDQALEADEQRRESQVANDRLLADMKVKAAEVGSLMKSGMHKEADVIKAEVTTMKQQAQHLKTQMQLFENRLTEVLYQIPNAPNADVKKGNNETQNETVYSSGPVPELAHGAKPHWELADKFGLIDFELGVKITGAGFPVYRGKGARLQRALINFFLDFAVSAGYEEIIPPLMVNEASGIGTGQLPDKVGQMYHIGKDGFYMIPTAEVPITNMYRDVILSEEELPIKLTGYTPCFRREAGSYGKDVRGLNRLHQFDKVEIVQFSHPDSSYEVLDEMVEHIKTLLKKLDLPFRILRLCGGDLGFASAITYDFEVYSAAQKRWLEVSSVSNFETYQSNRIKCRIKTKDKKSRLVHTLNGSALALPRIMAAILENNQQADGIVIPKGIRSYTGFDIIH